jgi:RNA polymerase sigma-B factor
LQKQGLTVAQGLRDQLGRQATDQEIADALEIPVEEWQQVKLAAYNRSPLSLDAPVGDDESGSTSLGEMVPDSQYRSFQLAQEDRMRLQQALQGLEQRTCEILEFVFLHDLTQKETAELLGISAVTVSRQVKKGLITLRKLMAGAEEA